MCSTVAHGRPCPPPTTGAHASHGFGIAYSSRPGCTSGYAVAPHMQDIDYSAYLASDTDDSADASDDDEEGAGSKVKDARAAMLAECRAAEEAEAPSENMEITWDLGLKERTESALQRRQNRIEEAGMTLGEKHEKKMAEKKKVGVVIGVV